MLAIIPKILFFKSKCLLKILMLLIPLIIISGCASLSKSECNKGDWANIGIKDGSRGLLATKQLKMHQSACAEYKVRPNINTYNSGYAQGLKQFCRRESGFKHGSGGSKYNANCPASLERNFLTGYIPGLELEMDSLQSDIDDLLHERYQVDRKLDALHYKKRSHKKRTKHIKKLESRVNSIQSTISSKRTDRNQLRSWHSRWVLKYK